MYVFQVGEHRHAHDAPVTMAAPMVVLLALLVTFGIYVGEVQRILVVAWGLR
jgi:NADH:ubiquinone oxidoreductase subunit 5 (subunit L)/multisubunit Na+/H+ antiporter MnhA subunit